jgi:riboflavin kinase/FMN adenylyltransferase
MHEIVDFINAKKYLRNVPLVIGFFDYLHRGHEPLFSNLTPQGFNVLTFTNVPSKKTTFLVNAKTKLKQLSLLSPYDIYVLDLDKLNVDAKKFIFLLKAKLNPSLIIVGKNFKFGKNRKGNVKLLKQHFNVKDINIDQRFSTTLIKKLLHRADLQKANDLLVEPYMINGVVVRDKKQGTKLGYPTANIHVDKTYAHLPNGVYAGYVFYANKKYRAAIYIKNTNTYQLIESHILDNFNQNIYKQNIKV